MIYATGDVHGNIPMLLDSLDRRKIPHTPDQIIILLGDVGLNYYGTMKDVVMKTHLQESGRTYFCIHGNHERRPESITSYDQYLWNGGLVYQEGAYPNLIFAKDGEVYDLEGLSALVIGGAYSVDKWYRLRNGWSWFEDEQVSPERRAEISRRVKSLGAVDLVLTHTCPYDWQPRELFLEGLDQSTVDNTMEHWLTEIEASLQYRLWLFGHFHGEKQLSPKIRMFYHDVISLEYLKKEGDFHAARADPAAVDALGT